MTLDPSHRTLTYRQTVVMVAVGMVFLGCLVILRIFIPALLLAAILCLSTWPAFTWMEKRLKQRTTLAAALMTLMLAICFLVPLVFLGTSLVESFRGLVAEISSMLQNNPVILTPEWVRNIPWAGDHLDRLWREYGSDKEHMLSTLKNNSGTVSEWLIDVGGGIGHGILDISLGIIMAFFFFQNGQTVVDNLRNLVRNFGGEKSLRLLHVSANTVTGVVYGILGTALVLGALATIGFLIAHVPGAPFLGLLTFLLGIIPGGPPFILAPVTIWLFAKGYIAMGFFMAVWSLAIVVLLDMVIRPYLISLGSKMPLILVLLGVFGGVASFGFIGLFIGPALLAIAAALVAEWSAKDTVPA